MHEQEKDDMGKLLSLIQTLPESEAYQIFRDIRAYNFDGDLGSFVRQIREGVPAAAGAQASPSQGLFTHQNEGAPPASAYQLPPLRSIVDLPQTLDTTGPRRIM